MNVYRISISWARIFSDGKPSSKNQKGIDHYHAVIDEIIKNNMTPVVSVLSAHSTAPLAGLFVVHVVL